MQRFLTRDARPQVQVLVVALAITVILWFVPVLRWVAYPFRLFVTFIHESGHALAALLTGNRVFSLSVDANGGGAVYHTGGSWLTGMFIASAGYLGAMAYGTLLLVLLRRGVSPRVVLYGSALPVLALTLVYGWSAPFTIVAGAALALALLAVGRYARPVWANFLVALLAVQCIANALFDLRTLLFLSAPFAGGARTDADNMARITHLPAVLWAVVWIGLAVAMLFAALRLYVGGSRAADPLPPPLPRRRARSGARPAPRDPAPWPPASERG